MSILIRETDYPNWSSESLVEVMCPECGSSCIESTEWEHNCWYCNAKLPIRYQHFLKIQMARFLYFKNQPGTQ